ncbi:MAG: hypothetical protein BWZ10_03354 [candidate division BRC1 bacterium ADurb.BinA364]|nr:MAG: hypothetical protein BWZ10_03354 [candidate division BRC1 bacterium ADurb.BinA364]
MLMMHIRHARIAARLARAAALAGCFGFLGARSARAAEGQALNVLFVGNSFTARHNLSLVVKEMAEAGNPGLRFDVATVIYGGRTLKDHWRLYTQNFVKIASLTPEEEYEAIAALQKTVELDPEDKFAKAALPRHRQWLESLNEARRPWDIVVLQSYKDDLEGMDSAYAEYAPKFAELIHAQGARAILYETTPNTQNDKPLEAEPDSAPAMQKVFMLAKLARQIGADVVPMSLAALNCQKQRPDLTLRFVNDAHLNHTMAYLTACAFYAVLFDKSPEGLPVDTITDIRFLDEANKDKDRDGGPIARTFSAKDRADLQRIAWESVKQFQAIAKDESSSGAAQ